MTESTANTYIPVDGDHIAEVLTRCAVSELETNLASKKAGHCIQITDIPKTMMIKLCQTMEKIKTLNSLKIEVYILVNSVENKYEITSTKLIERRNDPNLGILIAVVPPDLRTSAEDSFGSSTFAVYKFDNLTKKAVESLLRDIKPEYKQAVTNIINHPRIQEAGDESILNYLMSLKLNGYDPEALGAFFFYLGLIPDLKITRENLPINSKISKNAKAVQILAEPGIRDGFGRASITLMDRIRRLGSNDEVGLKNEEVPKELFRYLKDFPNLHEKNIWLQGILNQENTRKKLTFDKWEFRDDFADVTSLEITLLPLELPRTDENTVPIMDLTQQKKLRVKWKLTPTDPPDLDKFELDILCNETQVASKKCSRAKRVNIVDFSKIFGGGLEGAEEGVYTIRLSALNKYGSVVDYDTSDEFLLQKTEEEKDYNLIDEGESNKYQSVLSTSEAYFRAFINRKNKDKEFRNSPLFYWHNDRKKQYMSIFKIKYDGENVFGLKILSILKDLEVETLQDPQSLGRYTVDIRGEQKFDPEKRTLKTQSAIDTTSQEFSNFMDRRIKLFNSILDIKNGSGYALIETIDLIRFKDDIIEYARLYKDTLVSIAHRIEQAGAGEINNLIEFNKQIIDIDTIDLFLGNESDEKKARIMIPTHPMKMLWLLNYETTIKSWVEKMKNVEVEKAQITVLEDAVSRLSHLNFPHCNISDDGRIYVNIDNLNFFWSLFIPIDYEDPRSFISEIRKLMDLKIEKEFFTVIGPKELSSKIERFLIQHPYITTLQINIIYPGSARIILDTLSILSRDYPNINYDFRLISGEPRDKVGTDLDNLMSNESNIFSSLRLDEFLIASNNELFPRITYSKHDIRKFVEESGDAFEAHITCLFDFFAVKFNFRPPITDKYSTFICGLLNEYISDFNTLHGHVTWSRQIRPNISCEGNDLALLAYELHSTYNGMICSIKEKSNSLLKSPTIQLELDNFQKSIIKKVHSISDWVITIDKNFGVEYYDNPFDEYCQVYLIDYIPDFLGEMGHRLMISTESMTELSKIVQPALTKFKMTLTNQEQEYILRILQSISGRLVLKLISSPSKSAEAVSMALAKLFLQQTGFLDNKVLIPLDSHLDLMRQGIGQSGELQDEISFRRTDFLLVGVDSSSNDLCMDLVEIKYRDNTSLESLLEIKEKSKEQIHNTERALKRLYQIEQPDRIDRLIRSKELISLITFYAERAFRHRLLTTDNFTKMIRSLSILNNNYSLSFGKHVIIFSNTDTSVRTEQDGDIKFYTIATKVAPSMLNHYKQNLGNILAKNESLNVVYESNCLYSGAVALDEEKPVSATEEIKGVALDEEKPVSATEEIKGVALDEEKPVSATEEIKGSGRIPESTSATTPSTEDSKSVECDIIIGSSINSPQYGIIGKAFGRNIGLDLNGVNTISLFGVQGSGKSYTMGAIIEMALITIPGINKIEKPLSTIVFHYSTNETYKPEYLSLAKENLDSEELRLLKEKYNANASRISDIVILVPESKFDQRRHEYSEMNVHPILFDPNQLSYNDWLLLMGVPGSDRMYVKSIQLILKDLKREYSAITIDKLHQSIENSDELNESQKKLAKTRILFASEFLKEGYGLEEFVKPGKLVIVDLRNEMLDRDEAMRVLIVLLNRFNDVKINEKNVNKLIVLDEAHKYLQSEFANNIATVVREMRHQATSVLIASQDPLSVPKEVVELSSVVILHSMTSPDWLKHIKKGVTALDSLKPSELNNLQKGQAFVWAKESTQQIFKDRPIKVNIRPRVTQHGGGTITAL